MRLPCVLDALEHGPRLIGNLGGKLQQIDGGLPQVVERRLGFFVVRLDRHGGERFDVCAEIRLGLRYRTHPETSQSLYEQHHGILGLTHQLEHLTSNADWMQIFGAWFFGLLTALSNKSDDFCSAVSCHLPA